MMRVTQRHLRYVVLVSIFVAVYVGNFVSPASPIAYAGASLIALAGLSGIGLAWSVGLTQQRCVSPVEGTAFLALFLVLAIFSSQYLSVRATAIDITTVGRKSSEHTAAIAKAAQMALTHEDADKRPQFARMVSLISGGEMHYRDRQNVTRAYVPEPADAVKIQERAQAERELDTLVQQYLRNSFSRLVFEVISMLVLILACILATLHFRASRGE